MEKWSRIKYQPNLPLQPHEGGDGLVRVTGSEKHIELSKQAAKEGMVLLKNEADALPLEKGKRVALFGKATIDYVKGGGGSGDVTVAYMRNLAQGMIKVAGEASVFQDTITFYEKEIAAQFAAGKVPGMTKEPEVPDDLLKKARVFTDTAIISICRFSGEGWDRKSSFDKIPIHKMSDQSVIDLSNELFEHGDFYLSDAEAAMVKKVSEAFPRVIAILNVGGMVDVSWFKDNPRIQGALMGWQAGMEGGLAEAELLYGIGNPSGKLSDTLARSLEDYPCADSFYDNDDYAEYFEDIYVGYRYFETIPGAAEKVMYPFGYGLSYTTFHVDKPVAAFDGDTVTITSEIINTGEVPGKEVFQVYFSAPQGLLGKPAKQLAGYQKTRLLGPGERQVMTVRFPVSQMASYDDLGKVAKSAWLLEKGEYRFYAGTSVRDVMLCENTFMLEENVITEQVVSRMAPTQLPKRMLADGSFEELPLGEPNDPNASGFIQMDRNDMQYPVPAVRAYASHQIFEEHMPPQLIDVAEGRMSLDEFVDSLPTEDIAHLLGGQPNTGVANSFGFGNNPRYGIPSAMTADGPAGVRLNNGIGITTTAFPCATLLACSWNPDVCYAVGEVGGREIKENNLAIWLGPGVCIHRNPLCGRNFEYYSEDPYLAGKQGAAMVRGIQSNHVAATPKHFALNNKETNRKDSDSRASERAIREIYLKQFEIIVKEADPWCLMTGYNIVNSHRASENWDLLTGILREEWGYKGMVTSDWYTFGEHYKEAKAGDDIKMGLGYPDRLLAAIEKGFITREDLVICAKRILQLILKLD
ncbi:MAG: glycoside hydrolase family 3 protein [Firmicutes bacterium]|nr:glycoside hydrolase family 3 protein [Bacillota bacterium]